MKIITNILAYVLVALIIEGIAYGCTSLVNRVNDPKGPLYTATSSSKDSEGKTFRTVTLGSREWMAANLNVISFRDGSDIREATTQADWLAAFDRKEPVWAWITNDAAVGKTYGRIYNWYAITDPRGLAPTGWTIPDSSDWMHLARSARLAGTICLNDDGDTDVEGDFDARVLQLTDVEWTNPDLFGFDRSGTNLAGFNALPGGMIGVDGIAGSLEMETGWWGRDGLIMRIGNHSHAAEHDAVAFYQHRNTPAGCYVRCVRTAAGQDSAHP